MSSISSTRPLAAQRRLGDELRKLREQARMTTEEVGRYLGCHNSTVSRFETGKRACSKADFHSLMELWHVEGQQLADLTELMEKASQRVQPWWFYLKDVISAHYAEFLNYEGEATTCWEYQPVFIPALLQTEAYARAVTSVGFAALGPDQVDALVEVRMRRQERLREESPLVHTCVVTEAALRFQVGGPEVMREQLRHLAEVITLPNVSLRVIPFNTGATGLVTGSFVLFTSGKDAADVSFTESADTTSLRDDPVTLRRLSRLFDNLSTTALPALESRELVLHHIEKELGK